MKKLSPLFRQSVGCGLMAALLVCAGCSKPSDPGAVLIDVAPIEEETELGESGEAVLSEEDQALIAAQKVCPVGGPLGEHGTPVKVMVGDRVVFVCCEPCRGPLLKDPEKYLAKLDAAAAEATESSDAAAPEN